MCLISKCAAESGRYNDPSIWNCDTSTTPSPKELRMHRGRSLRMTEQCVERSTIQVTPAQYDGANPSRIVNIYQRICGEQHHIGGFSRSERAKIRAAGKLRRVLRHRLQGLPRGAADGDQRGH